MPAFVVNFSNKGRQRYMQVSIALMSRDQAALDALKVHMPLLRNRLVMLFSSQDFEALKTPVGKEMLRQQATASVQELAQKEIGKLAVEQVLFTNFVLQYKAAADGCSRPALARRDRCTPARGRRRSGGYRKRSEEHTSELQ